jgi:hypothetical protein
MVLGRGTHSRLEVILVQSQSFVVMGINVNMFKKR